MLSSLCLAITLIANPQESPLELSASPSNEASLNEPITTRPQRLLVHGGRIYLGNKNGSVVEALLIEDGRVVASGPLPDLGLDLEEPGLGKVDLKGAVAVPGLQDAHGNLGLMAATRHQVDLRGAKSFEEVIERVGAVSKTTKAGTWIVGWGWDQELWETREFPHHDALSRVVRSHPVLLHRIDYDAVLVNRLALKAAELDQVMDPPRRVAGGQIQVDEENKATGMLLGNAMDLVTGLLPKVTAEVLEQDLLAVQDELLSYGLTCVHDMGASPEVIEGYLRLRERGLLKLRIVAYLASNAGLSNDVFEGMPYPTDSEGLLRVAGVSFRLDGSLGSRGAALLNEYSDRPGEHGRMLLTESELTYLVHRAWQAGLQPAIHAVGDAANRAALSVYERMVQVDEGFARLRPRIEIAQMISSRDIPLFPALGVTPSMQPGRGDLSPELLLERLGAHRSEGADVWRSLAPGWRKMAFGSCFPVSRPEPIRGLYAARTRRIQGVFTTDGDLAPKHLSGLDALEGYTRGAAHAAHQEGERGQLLPGYWADLTVYDVDPVEGPPADMLEARVLLTMINGRIAYSL